MLETVGLGRQAIGLIGIRKTILTFKNYHRILQRYPKGGRVNKTSKFNSQSPIAPNQSPSKSSGRFILPQYFLYAPLYTLSMSATCGSVQFFILYNNIIHVDYIPYQMHSRTVAYNMGATQKSNGKSTD